MIPVPIIHRRLATALKPEVAAVRVSDAAAARDVLLAKAGLRLVITQKEGPEPRDIELTLEHAKGIYAAITCKNLPNSPQGAHPEGTQMTVQKVLLEFSPADFEEWLRTRP